MMNWILLVMGAIVSVVVAILVGGMLVPRRYAVARTLVLDAPPARVYDTLQDVAAWPVWVEQARTAVLLPLKSQQRHRTIQVLDDERREVARLTLAVEPQEHGSRVDASESGAVANPAARLLRQYVTGHATLVTAVLRALAEQLDEPRAAIRGG